MDVSKTIESRLIRWIMDADVNETDEQKNYACNDSLRRVVGRD